MTHEEYMQEVMADLDLTESQFNRWYGFMYEGVRRPPVLDARLKAEGSMSTDIEASIIADYVRESQ